MKFKHTIIIILAVCLLLSGGCRAGAPAAEKYQKQVYAMDTVMILTAYHSDEEQARLALEAAAARLLELEADLDPENEGGSLWAVNRNAGQWTAVSEDCLAVALTAQTVTERSGGSLQPRLYELVQAWGFISGEYRVPTEAERQQQLARTEENELVIDEEGGALLLTGGAVAFGAVAKGYAAEQALEAMAEYGVQQAIVSLGGNVQTLGEEKPDGSKWQVAVTDPADTGSYLALLDVGQTAVVTSGGYQRYFVEDGVTYIHILDPDTGLPADSGLTSLTVVCPDGAMADALSTALFVLGEEGALAYRKQYGGFELVLVTEDGRVVVTAGLADAVKETGTEYRFEYPED